MADREKVVKGLGQCTKDDIHECLECPYFKGGCTEDLIADALVLLKEQPKIVRCKDCEHFHSEVKDEFTTFFGCDEKHHPWGKNWFCADGKRRDDNG